MVSVEQVGIIVILTSLFGFLNIIFQQGIGSAAGRFYFTFKRKLERVNYLNSLTSYLLLSGIVLVVLGVWVSKYLGDWLGIDSTLIAITIVIAYLSAIINFYQTLLVTKELSKSFLVSKLWQAGVTVLFIVVSMFFYQASASGKIAGELMATSIVALGSLLMLFYHHSIRPIFNSFSHVLKSISFGLPVQLAGFGWWGMVNIDRFFLNHFVGISSVALYSVVYAVALLLNLFSMGFNQAWSIYYFKNYENEQFRQDNRTIVREYFGWLSFLALSVWLFSREAIEIMGGALYLGNIRLVPWIILGVFLYGLYFIPSRKLFVESRTWTLVAITSVGLGVNVLANLFLVPKYGMMGAAYATAIAYATSLLTTLVITKSWNWLKDLAIPALFFGACLVVFYGIYLLADYLGLGINLSVRALAWILFLGLALKFKVINKKVIVGIIGKLNNVQNA
ncbi:MAG: hypothetical protein A2119_02170 [Candidatus Colwellbacteria bacterium GWA2_46_10]|uniref:Uncharacterized protein n=1 Tax=Candidatus Colwellbacteria bacterium GWA2_46_10 TaxID=1797684 RepID=A0A1G1YVM8_9BACT|nr:MAG: hypothetical protein A2119_02170 [Candidatus Colwellbacteria bacterium GWA2_46_10]